ncbi:hypothetical protein CEK71_18715 [Methylovulum psychrotolerans]|uniref:Uncharacterized protein n=1 Tax=Methylovulum psychrotolerans TaxID=1704499 RepID=A0A1Z4C352_9GAMM|nr:hypothetical protein CEK71_18715 [Methylovulum psychrotolerans]
MISRTTEKFRLLFALLPVAIKTQAKTAYHSIIKFFIKPTLNRVGDLLKTQMYRVRLLPPLMGRVGVGRIKSMIYTYGLEILIRLLSV